MTAEYLPGTIRERIQDLVKERKITQGELAEKIGCTDSTLSRFLSGKTDKLSDENIIGIARVFDVSTDFLLGVTNVPDRKNYDVGELGLSVEAAKRLYTGKVNSEVVTLLLENDRFAELTQMLSRYFDDTISAGYAAQNTIFDIVAGAVAGTNREVASVIRQEKVPPQHTVPFHGGSQRNQKEQRVTYGRSAGVHERSDAEVHDGTCEESGRSGIDQPDTGTDYRCADSYRCDY